MRRIAWAALFSCSRNEEGQDLVEYALLASMIAVVALAVVSSLGQKLSEYSQFIVARLIAALH